MFRHFLLSPLHKHERFDVVRAIICCKDKSYRDKEKNQAEVRAIQADHSNNSNQAAGEIF
jgi:hypothetical protein